MWTPKLMVITISAPTADYRALNEVIYPILAQESVSARVLCPFDPGTGCGEAYPPRMAGETPCLGGGRRSSQVMIPGSSGDVSSVFLEM